MRLVRVLQVVLLVMVAVYALFAVTRVGPLSGTLEAWYKNVVYSGAALLLVLRAVWVRADRWAWVLLAFGMVCYAAALVYYSAVLAHLDPVPYPSISDAGWLVIYPCAFWAVGRLVRTRVRRFHASMWLDGMLAALGVASFVAAFVLGPATENSSGRFLAAAVSLAPPTLDVAMISLLVGVFVLFNWRPDQVWLLLAGGLGAFAFADSGFLFTVAHGSYSAGGILDLVWMAGTVLIGLAAWRPPGNMAPARLEGGRALALPGLFTLSSIALLSFATVRHVPVIATTLAAITLLVVFVRTGLTFREVTALAEARMEARTDDLTGLANRRSFNERLILEVDQRAADSSLAVLLVDLDRFKEINDSFGHDFGDVVLNLVGSRLNMVLRDVDTVARLGGDEFGVVLHGADQAYARAEACRLRAELRRPFELQGLILHLDASIGIALCPEHGNTNVVLLQYADIAMYVAKFGRTGFEVYNHDGNRENRMRFETLEQLHSAFADNQLVVHYQPKLETASGAIIGVEALVRWEHPTRGLVYPDSFLPLAEAAGLMGLVTLDVLDKALRQCRAWRDQGIMIGVAVNLSASDLQDSELAAKVELLLESVGLPPEALELEITESVVMADPERAILVLASLRALGLKLAIDDYGTGYSSLAYLRQLPVTLLKLDKTFVTHMDEDARSAAIVDSTIALAHSLGMAVVAEGVETENVLRQLVASGCDLAQGYHISRPQPADRLTPWLKDKRALPTPS
ncbi:MAG: diguanylate cyclase, partial [Ilumatobacteraceae bacterium]